jgi:hypothetical protein
MKNTPALKILQRRWVLRFPTHLKILAVAIAVGLTGQATYAGTFDYTLALTEFSSTNLMATYSGPNTSTFSVMNTSVDHWTVSFSGTVTFNNFDQAFIEPENAAQVNEVSHSTYPETHELFVVSDEPVLLCTADGMWGDGTSVAVGMDGYTRVLLVFKDMAANSEAGTGVPEGGSTLGLVALSLAALLGFSRLRSALTA